MSRSFESDPSSDSEAASAARARATARAISIRHFDPSTIKGNRFDPFLRSSSNTTIAPGNADTAPVSPIQAPGVEPPIELVPPTPLDGDGDEEKKTPALEPHATAVGSRGTSGGPPSPSNRGKRTGRDRSFSLVSLSQAVGDDECGICYEQLVIGVEDDETGNVSYLPDDVELKCGHHYHWACFVDYSATSAQHRTMCPVCTRSTLTPEPNSSKLRLLVTVRNEGGTTIEYDLGEALDEDLVWQQQEENGAAYEALLAAEAEKRKTEEADTGHVTELGAKLAVLCQKHEWKAALELISELREEEDRDQREIVDFLVDETKMEANDDGGKVEMKGDGQRGVGWSGRRSGLHLAVLEGDMEWVMFLLSNGANRTPKDADGKTPAEWAEERGHPEIATIIRGA